MDPAGSRLPKLVNPNRVGNSLLWLMCCLLLSSLLLVVFALDDWLQGTGLSGRPEFLDLLPLADFPWIAAVVGFAGLAGVWGLAYPQGPDPTGSVRRDLRLMALGLAIWSCMLLAQGILIRVGPIASSSNPLWPGLSLVADVGAAVGLVGLRGTMLTIGLRSREYRNARGARQGLTAMVAAVCAHAVGRLLQFGDAAFNGGLPISPGFSQVLVSVSMLMLVIGLAYLVVNAWWIRSSLRKPPQPLEELLMISEPIGEKPSAGKGLKA